MTHNVKTRIVLSGDIVEVYEYSKGYLKDYKAKRRTGRSGFGQPSANEEENRQASVFRAKQKIRRIINSNANDLMKFMTLTYSENEEDLYKANDDFKNFIKRLNYKLDRKIKYLAVIEFQERGAIHYHMLCDIPYVKQRELQDLWGHGFVWINRIDKVTNVGAYVTSYMTKEDDERLKGRKMYLSSRGLKQPIEITQKKEVAALQEPLLQGLEPVYTSEFENEYTGTVIYKQYNRKMLKNQKAVVNKVAV